MGLSNYQLVLLDNLIYLDEVTRVTNGEITIGKIVNNLLYAEGSDKVGSGTIIQDCLNHYKPGDPEAVNCMMTKEEWIEVLKAIEADPVLCSLTVHKVENHTEGALDGFRAMALTGEGVDENIIIFQGTTSAEEWMEDAAGGYSVTTAGQRCALDFVNGLDIVNNKPFVVSGHSKGGNMAQYVALFASDPTIDKCLSFDGQGFSKELCDTEAYKEAIKKKAQNLYLIASSGDYVNVLFNSPVPDNHKMYVEANNVFKQFLDYHKPNTVFTIKEDDGSEYNIVTGLNTTTKMKLSSVFIQDFVSFIIETETDAQKKKTVFDALMGILAATAETEDEIELGISGDVVMVLWTMPVLAASSGILAPFGMDKINFFKKSIEDYIKILDSAAAEVYQGVLYKAVQEGELNLMIDYLGQYITASTKNQYTVAAFIDDVVSGNAFENWGDMGKNILNLFWKGVVNCFDTTTGGSIEEYLKNMYNSFAVTTTLGEGSKGVVYRKEYEHGGILHIGTGENERSIVGTGGDDILFGGNGADVIYGGAGDDLLVGGKGNDHLYGGDGNDTYFFQPGDGQDRILASGSGTDRIVFGEGILPEDMEVTRDAVSLYIRNRASGDSIEIRECYLDENNFVGTVEFADGTVWGKEQLKEMARHYHGTEGSDILQAYDSIGAGGSYEGSWLYGGEGYDSLYGSSGNDELYGEEGDDSLFGGAGDDLLAGGKGNDNLYGGNGDDTYLFDIGDGQDTITESGGNDRILFGEGIEKFDLIFAREQNHLKISLAGREDTITVSNHFGNEDYRVESFQTSDGSILDYTKLNVIIQAMASFEDTTGMMWEDAVVQKNEEVNDMINQWWTKEVI